MIFDWGFGDLGIGGLGIGNWRLGPIQNPQSPIFNLIFTLFKMVLFILF
jgi:hypothetical protein